MRSSLLRAGLAASLVTFAACGGSETPTAPATPTTMAPKPLAGVTTTTVEEEYELDVIAEAEPDEGAPPLKVQFTASVEEERGVHSPSAGTSVTARRARSRTRRTPTPRWASTPRRSR